MMNHTKTEEFKLFREGLEELLFVNPVFGALAREMGVPIWDTSQPTAYVTYDEDERAIVFAFNPDFIATLSVEERAAVIAHETHHVALDHLMEVLGGAYPNQDALLKAHECIINDTLDTVFQLPLPPIGVLRGPEQCGRDCTPMSTRMAYDIFDKMAPKADQPDPSCPKHGKQDKDKADQPKPGEDGPKDGSEEGDGDAKGQPEDAQGDSSNSGPEDADHDCTDGAPGDKDGDGGNQPDPDAETGESQAGDEAGKGDGAGDEEGDGGDQPGGEGGHGHGDTGPECTCKNGQANGDQPGVCQGIKIAPGQEAAAAKAANQIIQDAADAMGMSKGDLEAAIANTTGGGYSPTGADVSEKTQITKERMNWKLLLNRINPKVMEAGKRIRTKNNWTSYNRRMGAVYPKVILPKNERVQPKAKEKGDSLPVLVVALDLSGSIPRTLVKTLQGLLNEIPEDLIKAYPCTWGSNLIPYVEGGQVAGGGTNIQNVVNYVKKVQQETGTDPYVLCITDGEFTNKFERAGKEWFFMSVDKGSIPTFVKASGSGYYGYGGHVATREEVYVVDDFKI